VGDRMQSLTWTHVVEKMIEVSQGTAPAGVEHASASLDEEEAKAIEHWVEELAMRRKRAENAERIEGAV
jgi:hypothetical protein